LFRVIGAEVRPMTDMAPAGTNPRPGASQSWAGFGTGAGWTGPDELPECYRSAAKMIWTRLIQNKL
jgi:hypothetical protein